MSREHWSNDADRGNRSTERRNCYGATSTTTNPARTDLGLNPHFSSKRLVSTSLGHGTASLH